MITKLPEWFYVFGTSLFMFSWKRPLNEVVVVVLIINVARFV